jgi:predicted enzyme related to lactoylglutathione lyase
MDACRSGGNGILGYFSCADCAIEAKRAKDNGGQLFREQFSIGANGFIALVGDSEGNMIGLHSMQ